MNRSKQNNSHRKSSNNHNEDPYKSMADNDCDDNYNNDEYVGQNIINNIKNKIINIKNNTLNYKKKNIKKHKKLKMTKKKIFKVIGLFLIIVLFINIFSVFRFFLSIKNTVKTQAISPGFFKPVNILVLGMDIGAVGQENNNDIKRTDTMMVVNYNPRTKTTKVVSIPRDTLITENGSNYKINAAYVKGQDQKVKEVVEKLLNITVN